jgi:hypothetical protein
MLAAAEAADAQEDETFGKDRRGDELPDWVGDKQKRLAKIQQAMAALEADAKPKAARSRAPPSDEPNPKAQRNFTDPESRIMKSKDGFVQAYNGQAAVDAGAQIIVAHELTQCGNDQGQLVPRAKHPTAANGKIGGPLTQRMRTKIDDGGFETPYRLRKQVVEPVFGQIKQARGFRQFLLRGVEKVRAEWAMICTAHNLQKLFILARAA